MAATPMTTSTTSYAPSSTTLSAPDLLLRVVDGDPVAWAEVVHRYGGLVSATVRSFRLQDTDALDAVQTTWLRLAEYAHQIQDPRRLPGWLITTARRACLHMLRQARPTVECFPAVAEKVADPTVSPEQHVINADTTRRLWNFVSELSPRQQAVLRALFTDHPRCYAEVAQMAGIAPGGIGPTRARALAKLRNRFEQHELGPGAWR